MPDNDNEKVTLAVAVAEIKHLGTLIEDGFSDAKEERAEMKAAQQGQDKRVRANEIELGRNQVQHKLLAGTQLVAFVTAVGSFFGR